MAENTALEHIEPWNCCACGKLIYNVVWIDGKEYPAPGAPPALFVDMEYPRLCRMCFDMLEVIQGRRYFVDLEADARKAVRRIRECN